MTEQDRDYLSTIDAVAAAKRLLGCELVRYIDGHEVRVRIVETEAYDQTDAASHSYNGRTQRVDVMFGPAGHLYVYFTYGMHHCCNVVVGPEGYGAAVLIRAVEPLNGSEVMERSRKKAGVELTNGPAKLCQALGIDRRLNGHDLAKEPMRLLVKPPLADEAITTATRIGISKATHEPWRFYVTASDFVSHR
jgi:DNA-3-methyladenine glycosylase